MLSWDEHEIFYYNLETSAGLDQILICIFKTHCKTKQKPAIAAMHGPHSLVRFGDKVRNKLNYRSGPIR